MTDGPEGELKGKNVPVGRGWQWMQDVPRFREMGTAFQSEGF